MQGALIRRLSRLGRFAWSAWAGATGLFLLAAIWQAGHEAYGSFILPAPVPTFNAAITLLAGPEAWMKVSLTAGRALRGFVIAALTGSAAGLIAGY
jgi:NitT/TauT family transport system permease protein